MGSQQSSLTLGTLVDWHYVEFVEKLNKKLKRTLKRKLKAKNIQSNRINTFSVTAASLNNVPNLGKRVHVEEAFKAEFTRYSDRINSKRRNSLKYNGDSELYITMLDTLGLDLKDYLHLRQHEAIDFVEEQIEELITKAHVAIWSLEDEDDKIVMNEFVANVKNSEIDLSQSIDELLITNLARSFLPFTDKLLGNLMVTLDKLASTDLEVIEESYSASFESVIMNVIGIISSLQESLKLLEREVWRVDELALDTVAELRQLNSEELQEWLNIDYQQMGAEILELIDQIKATLINLKPRLRHMLKSKNAKFEADLKDPFVSIINFRAQVTGLRLWIHSFEDLPSFTSLSDGIAYEYVENETYEPTKSALIEGVKLFKNYSRGNSTIYALRGVNVLIKEGDFVIIRGPSGSGKTTLLNTLSGLDTVGRGAVFFQEENLQAMKDKHKTKLRRDYFSFIFQSYALIPHLSAYENAKVPVDLSGLSKELKAGIQELLNDVGIGEFSDHKPALLSGGQMQRLGIARALTSRPKIIFADEPTGDLDRKTGLKVMNLLKKYHEETNVTIVLVTHDSEIAKFGSREILLQDGQIVDKLRYT